MATSEELQRHYREYYSGGEEEWRRIGAIGKADNIVRAWRLAGSSPKPSVVELGCGNGAIAARLSSLAFFRTYQGFDLSESGIQAATARGIPDATFAVTTSPTIPVESADVVIMSHVIEHLEHPRELIGEARRIAPILIAEVPCELHGRLPYEYDWDPVGHINHYNPAAIRKLLQTCRFDVIDQFTTNTSRQVATFKEPGFRSAVKWSVKQTALWLSPRLATTQFTYHETLVARRNNRSFGS
jgi:SAM-dependent methyltransferase